MKTLILEKKRFFDKEKNYRKVKRPTEYKTKESILDNFELKTKPVLKHVIFFVTLQNKVSSYEYLSIF